MQKKIDTVKLMAKLMAGSVYGRDNQTGPLLPPSPLVRTQVVFCSHALPRLPSRPVAVAAAMKDVDNPNIVKTQFHTALPLNGKYVIVMEVDLMSPVALIKRQFHARERLETPVEQLALYMYGVELEDDRTLFSYQFVVHKSVIGVRGAYYDFHVTTAVTAYSVPVRWHRHITVTEMLRAVWKRLAPNLDHVRFDIDGKTIPFKKCYRQSEQQLPWHATLQDLGLATRQQEHCSVCFRRARNGAALHIQFDLPSVATVQDLHESVQEWELRQRIRAATPEAQGGWMEEVLGAKDPRGPVAEGARDDQYDDDDEAVAPSGRKSVYLYTQGMPDYRHEEGMYKGEAYFSYHPPQVLAVLCA